MYRYATWENDIELGPVSEGDVLSVPLLCACASSIMLKPADAPYKLSKPVPCAIQTYDFKASQDVLCIGDTSTADSELARTFIHLVLNQTDRSILITCMPYIVIENRMPCDMHYRVREYYRVRVLALQRTTSLHHCHRTQY